MYFTALWRSSFVALEFSILLPLGHGVSEQAGFRGLGNLHLILEFSESFLHALPDLFVCVLSHEL